MGTTSFTITFNVIPAEHSLQHIQGQTVATGIFLFFVASKNNFKQTKCVAFYLSYTIEKPMLRTPILKDTINPVVDFPKFCIE